jgi:hypothetical protein
VKWRVSRVLQKIVNVLVTVRDQQSMVEERHMAAIKRARQVSVGHSAMSDGVASERPTLS